MKQSNPTLSNAIALALCSAGVWWGITIPNPIVGIPVSMGSYAALDAHRRKYKWEVRPLLGECTSAAVPLLESTAESLRDASPGEDAGFVTKWGYKLLMKAIGERTEDNFQWFSEMQFGMGEKLMPYGNWLICGEQREGKSSAARHMFARYLEQHQGCQVLICDVENQSHPDGYWFGVPVADTPIKVVQSFEAVRTYLDTAKGDGSDPGLVVMFDEVKSTFNSINSKQRDFIINTLQDCHSKGAKRKVLVLNIMHTLTGSVLNWKGITDFAPKSNILMLQRFANDDANFSNLQYSEGCQQAREAIAIHDVIPLQSGDPRPCLLYTDKRWSCRWIPTLEDVQMVVTDEPEPDPYCHIQEFIEGVEFPCEPLTLTEIWALCGVKSSTQKLKDGKYYPQWVALRDAHNAPYESENPFEFDSNLDDSN